MPKYTPEKWKVTNRFFVENENGVAIADCEWNAEETAAANARLISAAPELLEALKNLIGFHCSSGLLPYDSPERIAIILAEQAITKAEEKSNG